MGEFSIYVTVSDLNQAEWTQKLAQCHIQVTTNITNDCNLNSIRLSNLIATHFSENPYLSKHKKLSYILQVIQVALSYLELELYNNIENAACSKMLLQQILVILDEYFGSSAMNLCERNYVLVCELNFLSF